MVETDKDNLYISNSVSSDFSPNKMSPCHSKHSPSTNKISPEELGVSFMSSPVHAGKEADQVGDMLESILPATPKQKGNINGVAEVAKGSVGKDISLIEMAKAANLVLNAPESRLPTLFRKVYPKKKSVLQQLGGSTCAKQILFEEATLALQKNDFVALGKDAT